MKCARGGSSAEAPSSPTTLMRVRVSSLNPLGAVKAQESWESGKVLRAELDRTWAICRHHRAPESGSVICFILKGKRSKEFRYSPAVGMRQRIRWVNGGVGWYRWTWGMAR